jgi:hypothetical protein
MATRYGVETKMKAGYVLKETIAYFGPQGLGLKVTNRTLTSVRLEAGSSFVEVEVRVGKPTDVDIVLHEWEQQAVKFMKRIKK